MVRKYTQETFCKKAKEVNPNIEILGKYINMKTKLKCRCIKHSYEWDGYPISILKGCGCKYCKSEKISNALSLSYDELISRIKPTIEIIGNYVNTMTPVLAKCKTCGHEWTAYPGNLLKNYGCPLCSGRYKDNEMFVKELSTITHTILPLEKYSKSKTKILCKCLVCGRVFKATPEKLLSHRGCPYCKMSKGEKLIRNYLEDNDIKYIPQMKFNHLIGINGRQLSYDFYIPDYNLLIEYQGEFHDGTARIQSNNGFTRQKEHDRRKKQFAKDNHIELLEIWYYEQNKIGEILNEKLNINNIKEAV